MPKPKVRDVAKLLFIPRMAPLLIGQLFVYGIVLLIGLGIFWTKFGKPGLEVFGIYVVTTADRVEENRAKIESLEAELGTIHARGLATDTKVNVLLKAIVPDEAAEIIARAEPKPQGG